MFRVSGFLRMPDSRALLRVENEAMKTIQRFNNYSTHNFNPREV